MMEGRLIVKLPVSSKFPARRKKYILIESLRKWISRRFSAGRTYD